MSQDEEPSFEELIRAAEEAGLNDFKDIAFVGLGEPTLRLDLVCRVGRYLRERGHRVRLVTDGLASLRAGHDVTAQLAGAIDEVHVSLNAPDPETYGRICPNRYGEDAHEAVCDFIRSVQMYVSTVKATVIELPGIDLAACERLASELRVSLRIRPYFDPLTGQPHEANMTPDRFA